MTCAHVSYISCDEQTLETIPAKNGYGHTVEMTHAMHKVICSVQTSEQMCRNTCTYVCEDVCLCLRIGMRMDIWMVYVCIMEIDMGTDRHVCTVDAGSLQHPGTCQWAHSQELDLFFTLLLNSMNQKDPDVSTTHSSTPTTGHTKSKLSLPPHINHQRGLARKKNDVVRVCKQ